MSQKTKAKERPISEPKPNRSHFLPRTRCTENERHAVEKKATSAGLSLSEYQRRAIFESTIIIKDNQLELQAVRQLSAIGNNLNQLVRKAHINDEADSQKIRETLNTIDHIVMGLVCDT